MAQVDLIPRMFFNVVENYSSDQYIAPDDDLVSRHYKSRPSTSAGSPP